MKKIIPILFIFFSLTDFAKAQTTVTDFDGNIYQTVQIGNQIWMAENLKTTKYNDGTAIPLVTDPTTWINLTTPGYCWYNNDQATYKATYGALYNWYTVNTGKLCPTGWHVPTDSEWTTLETYLGGSSVAGGKLKEIGTTHWFTPNEGATNESGFTALPGGIRDYTDGSFINIGYYGLWWSSTEDVSPDAWCRYLAYINAYITKSNYNKKQGFSIRCLRDDITPILTTTEASSITQTTAESGGNITDNGGATVTERGVCWSTSSNPTTSDNFTKSGTGTGVFTSSITLLLPGTTYYVRAYAMNSVGTAYGNEISFTTYKADAITDYDGNYYNIVTIGNQVWMKENLKTTHYADGTPLVSGTGAGDITGDVTTKYYFWYADDSATYADTYGALYTWAAVMNGEASSDDNPSGVQGVCPDNWHVPSDTEWKELEMYLGMSQAEADITAAWRGTDEGGKLKETGTTHWDSPNSGATNESGFTALPGGYRGYDGAFLLIGSDGHWWSAAENDATHAWFRRLNYNSSETGRYDGNISLGFSVRCVKTHTLYTDSLALVALYNSTNGTGWTNKDYWLTGPVSTWYGITVSGNRVTQIDLNTNNLIGTIPPEIGNLTNLTHSQLFGNQLSGLIPPEIGNLINLNVLYLGDNQLSGSIPAAIGNLTNLIALELYGNQLSGSIPTEIGNLTNLSGLQLHSNQLSGAIPTEIGNLTNLTGLWLNDNLLSGSIPTEIGSLTNLTDLALYSNQLTGSIPTEIGSLTNLGNLNLHDNQLSGSIPTEIGNLTNLTNLSLYSNQLSGAIPPQIGSLINLTVLYLFSNQLSGPVPSEIVNMTSLQILSINENQLTGLPDLSPITTLSEFNASINQLTFRDIEPNIGVATNFFYYSPQDSVGEIIDTTVFLETSYTMSVSTGGASSQYQWKKDGTNIGTVSIDSTYTINPATFSETGAYTCEITNTVATDLTLYSRPINVFVDYSPLHDSLVLVALYDSTDGANWTDNTNWLFGSVSTWYGITVSGNGRVTKINLDTNNLVGTIPPEIGSLTNLTWLNLGSNQLSGSIPPEIGNLTNLTYLRLEGNQLSGSIPIEIWDITNLTFLGLWANQLSGSIPTEIGNLTNLTYLNLGENPLSGSIPAEIGNLTNLTELWLYSTPISGSIPTEIGSLTNLTSLGLWENQLSGSIPAEIWNLTNLTNLWLYKNQLTGAIPTEIGNLTNLTALGLSDNQLSGSIPAEIGNLTNLPNLWLHNNQLSGAIPPELGNLTNLIALGLTNNLLSGSIPPEIGNLSNLSTLRLNNNQLSGSIPTDIGNLTNLTELWLFQNQLTGSIPPEIGNLSNLTDLWLHLNQLTGAIPAEIGNLSNLSILYLANNLLSGSIPAEIGNLTNLTQLGIEVNNFSGPFPPEICNLTNLEALNLGSIQLTGTLPKEIGNLTNLKWLYLNSNQLTDSVPTEIGNLTSLIYINLDENQFTYLPDLSTLTSLENLYIQNNQFTFKDIEPNIGVASNYGYTPQDSVGEIINTTAYVGTSYTMSVSTGGTNSQYQWKKDGVNIGSLSGDSTYTINPVAFSDSGTYTCEITNTVATDLTLYSRPVNVNVEVQLCDMISTWEDITPPWQSYDPGTFIVDTVENPDKTGINPSDSCAKLTTTADYYEYMWYDLPGTEIWSFNTHPVYKLMVNAPTEGNVVLRFENSDNTVGVQRQVYYSNPGSWEELVFDFTGVVRDSLIRMVIYPDYDSPTAGNEWHIDEIIHCDLHLNAGIVGLIIPRPGCGLTNSEPITVLITNFGIDTISNFDVSYQINDDPIITETVTNTIAPGDTLTHTFSTNADLYTTEFYQRYAFTANNYLPSDEAPNNDQYYEVIGVYGYYTDREGWTTYGICDGMAGDGGTTGVVEDGSGNIWVGTDEGVSVYNGASWVTYDTTNSPLTSNAIETLYADDLGNVWIGTWKDEGGVCKYDGSTWTVYKTENSGIAGNVVEEVIKDSNGNYWFSTWSGISKFDGTTIWTTYNTGNSSLVDDFTNAITEDSYGNIWIGTESGVSTFDVTSNSWTTYNTANSGLGSNYIYAIKEDTQGNIWIGTDGGGITKYDGSTWTTYTTSNSDFPINRVFSIMADSNGNVWFGTFGKGAVKYDGTTWINYNEENGLVTRSYNDGRIFFWGDIFEDSNGNIWFPAYNGLTKKAQVNIEIYKIEFSNSTCNGTNDGSITIYALAENPPLQYSIDGGTTYQFDSAFTSLSPGIYPIVVTDGVNTVSTDTVVLMDFENISTYPYTENFDTYAVNSTSFDYGWYNESTNNLDWMVYSGSTPSVETGPETDQSGSGNYLYLEASANFLMQSSIISPCFDISGLSNPTLKFYYHMYGSNMGELSLDIYSGGAWINDVVYISGDQGTDWLLNTVDLSSYSGIIKLRFRGITGDSFRSDIAIDNIEVAGLSEENDILTFSFPEQTGAATIDNVNHTVDIEVSLSTDVTALVATFIISDLANITVSSTSQVSGVTSNDFTSPVTYTVTAEDGTTQDWVVTVTVATSLSSENDMLSFSFAEQTDAATINDGNNTIDIEVVYGTDVTGLVATFTISNLANITVNTTSQVSGVTSNDFSSPVTYTVAAEDGTTQDWVVTVTVASALSSENDILSFSFDEQTGAATINNVNHTISIAVANGTDMTNLVATFTISDLATIDISGTLQVSGVTANNFSNPVTYTVTAEDDTQQNWVITVTTSTPVIISSFPYLEDFETGNGDWYAGGTNSSWEHGIPSAGQTINSAASGNNAWVTNLTGDYNMDEVSYVTSPQFDLSSLNFPKIEFSIWWHSEGFYDGANLQYKLGSNAWKTLGIEESDDSWYNSAYLYSIENGFGFDLSNSAGWSGDDEWGYGSNGWVTVDHALTGFDYQSTNVTFRIGFASNSGYENEGVAFDDINIFSDPTGIDPVKTGLSDIQIYPNPNEGTFTLVYNGERDVDLKLQLINIQGQVIMSDQIKTGHRFSKEFELEYLSAGIYYFRLMNREGVVVKKMVIK